MGKSTLSKDMLLSMYESMVRIRQFEVKSAESFMSGLCAGNIHLCIGQEGSTVGAVAALEPGDYITSTHRGHGHTLAKGARTDKAMAELFGKVTGYCKGKGGSMHIADMSIGHLGANGIVGAGIPIATGSALAAKIKKTNDVTLCFFGDSASNQGTFHESVNMAAAWSLPVVYLCENNGYGVSVAIGSVTNTSSIAVRAKAYNIPGVTVDGGDVPAVYAAVKEAVDRARAGQGPSLVECLVYRHQGHYCGDPAQYRPASYMEEARKHDPIERFGAFLLENGFAQKDLEAVEQAVTEEMEKAFLFSQESPYPDAAAVAEDVYAQDNDRSVDR